MRLALSEQNVVVTQIESTLKKPKNSSTKP
jgi:hypothetical protein